jgi:hypothetical protein
MVSLSSMIRIVDIVAQVSYTAPRSPDAIVVEDDDDLVRRATISGCSSQISSGN